MLWRSRARLTHRLDERMRQVLLGAGVGGIDLYDLGETRCGTGMVAAEHQHVAQVGVRLLVLRIRGDGSAVGGLGASQVPALLEEDTQIEVRIRILRVRGDGSVEGGLCLLYTSPSPRDQRGSRMPSSA